MITLCHAAKGGSGTTLVASTRAIRSPGPTLLVDLEGDVPGMLGLAEPVRPGVIDWLASDAPTAHLDDLLAEVTPNCSLLPASEANGRTTPVVHDRGERWDALGDWLCSWADDSGGSVVVDAGTRKLPATFVERCPVRWLVTRACYLALRRASRLTVRPTGVVLVDEPGRQLRRSDIEVAVGAPVVATLAWDIRIARSVDAGLLLCGRLPRPLGRAFADVAA
jgi:hypothetical protein